MPKIACHCRQSESPRLQQQGAEQESDELQDIVGHGELRDDRGVQAALQEAAGEIQDLIYLTKRSASILLQAMTFLLQIKGVYPRPRRQIVIFSGLAMCTALANAVSIAFSGF